MKRFLKSLVAVALATTTLADFDIEVAGNFGAYASKSSTVSWSEVVGTAAPSNTSRVWTTNALGVNSYGIDIRGLYCVRNGFYLGGSVGYSGETTFPKDFKETEKAGEPEDKEVEAASQTGTAFHLIPMKVVVKYDFNDALMAESNIYLTARVGVSYALNANSNALKTSDRYTAVVENSFKAKADKDANTHTAHVLAIVKNIALDLGGGFEYSGFQVETYYSYKSVSAAANPGEVATNAATNSTEAETKATSAYANHSANVSIGYRLKDLL